MSSFIIYSPKSKKKADNNSPSEQTGSKSVIPVVKFDRNYSPPFDIDKESPSDENNKWQGLFVNYKSNNDLSTGLVFITVMLILKMGLTTIK